MSIALRMGQLLVIISISVYYYYYQICIIYFILIFHYYYLVLFYVLQYTLLTCPRSPSPPDSFCAKRRKNPVGQRRVEVKDVVRTGSPALPLTTRSAPNSSDKRPTATQTPYHSRNLRRQHQRNNSSSNPHQLDQ